jgi:hypothetical protein
LFLDIAQFIRYYGNDTFKDGDISYHLFVYLSRQIPALEARDIFVAMEGCTYGYSGASTPQLKQRFTQLQDLLNCGVKI